MDLAILEWTTEVLGKIGKGSNVTLTAVAAMNSDTEKKETSISKALTDRDTATIVITVALIGDKSHHRYRNRSLRNR